MIKTLIIHPFAGKHAVKSLNFQLFLFFVFSSGFHVVDAFPKTQVAAQYGEKLGNSLHHDPGLQAKMVLQSVEQPKYQEALGHTRTAGTLSKSKHFKAGDFWATDWTAFSSNLEMASKAT